jgi:hypothetical protein
MSRVVTMVALIAFCVTLSFAADAAAPAAKTYGKALTLKEVTEISKLNAAPNDYKDEVVMVAGKVVNVCQGSGCWLEVEAADSSRIICKSMDESIHFPKTCAGSMVIVEGKVLYDTKASGRSEIKHEEGMAPHACPSPKCMVSISGAELTLASADEAKTPKADEQKPEEKKDESK